MSVSMEEGEADRLRARIAQLEANLASAQATIRDLNEKLDAALDGTGLCLWQGVPPTGELKVFNLQNFRDGDMAPNFDAFCAKLHPEDAGHVLANYHAHLAGKTPRYESQYRTVGPDGTVTWLWDQGRVIERDARGRALRILGTHVDITQRKLAEQELARLAWFDPLTGLPNRMHFFRQLEQAISELAGHERQLAVLFLDLDYFKHINDQYGHVIGDQVLIAVAGELRQILRDEDIVARLGGDEFIVLLKGAGIIDKVRQIAARILQSIGPTLQVGELSVRLGTSIGVSLFPDHGATAEELVLHADSAMYSAKSAGRHMIVHYQPGPSRARHDVVSSMENQA
ncbi:sensor domain-containing diguanylate cyclase [Paludibacterium sp. B53371]|uniref:sensor domain-containing diguanylate cyclase n=1 Tax=Paludibacterium sp. B53371 TaxID=2806263 RepID=UPI00207B810F|nr:sensor domain-containing diguanylate cyclase [Paludibacterium sp. B53371]